MSARAKPTTPITTCATGERPLQPGEGHRVGAIPIAPFLSHAKSVAREPMLVLPRRPRCRNTGGKGSSPLTPAADVPLKVPLATTTRPRPGLC